MHLNRIFSADTLLCQESGRVVSLVSLKLDDLAELVVLNDGAVACELLLEGLDDFLEVDLGVNALHGGQALAAVSLLDADVNDVFWCARCFFFFGVCEGIERPTQVLNVTEIGHKKV